MAGRENNPSPDRYDIANASNLLSEIREGLKPSAGIEHVLNAADQTAGELWGDEQNLLGQALDADPDAWFMGHEQGYEYSCWTVPETITPAGRALVEVFQRDNLRLALAASRELNPKSYTLGFVIGATQGRAAGNGRTTQGDNT